MTIPWLMNCAHSEEGWCLDCTRVMGEENMQLRARVEFLEHQVGCSDIRCKLCPTPSQPKCAMCGGNRDHCGHYVGHGAL